jgi:hypothetical protein
LPAIGIPRKPIASSRDGYGRQRRAIIVQAEVDATGNTLLGMIEDGIPRTAKPDEFSAIKPFTK